jgi:cell wall-associated NlpC family hydrolase
MRTVRPTSSAPHRKNVQRATAALGLLCALTAGSCWAQQTAQAADGEKPAAAAKHKQNGKQSAKPASTSAANTKRDTKSDTKSAHSKQDSDKSKSGTAAAVEKADKADKVAKADLDSKPQQDKPELKRADKVDAKVADLAPPPGTMMGAYGQSLMRTASVGGAGHAAGVPSPSGAAMNAQVGSLSAAAPAVASVAAAQNASATSVAMAPSITAANTMMAQAAPALPATAMMGAAGVSSSDSVSRFLQQHGIVAQAQAQTQAENAALAGNPSLLNEVRDRASNLVLSAMNFLGVPYRRGGNSVSNGFDCSGFTRHIFEMSVGLVLPRRADEQAKMSSLISIKKEDLKPGDLVFFNTMRATFSHVGIYVGEGKFIHSPRAGGAVRVEDMREAYWAKRFTGARRADLTQAPNT